MKTVSFEIDDKLAEKFELAIQLTGDDRTAVAEEFIKQYLGKALHAAAEEFHEEGRGCPPPPPPPRGRQQTEPQRDSADSAQRSRPRRARPDHEQPPREEYWRSWGKAIPRIPRWARHPQQNNHKILRAYFEVQKELGKVTLDALRKRCSDPERFPRTFVPHFDNNFAQMKFDNGNSHGKVFEEEDGYVTIWDQISDTLMKYRDYFLY